MKKVLIGLALLLITVFVGNAYAQEAEGFRLTFPQETAVTAFWFPSNGVYAGGVAHTFVRIEHSSIPKIYLDGDLTVAKEFNNGSDTLAGLGIKVGYKPSATDKTGFAFEPSLGIAVLSNFLKGSTLDALYSNHKLAIYGNVLLYRW